MTIVLFHMATTPSLRRDLESVATSIDDTLRIEWCDDNDDDRFHRLLHTADVLWHLLRPVGAADLDRAPNLQLVQKLGSGTNTIDVAAAAQRNVRVCNLPGTNAPAVAEATIGLMLAVARWIPQLDAMTRAGSGWPTATTLFERSRELAGSTVGLIGHGAIAQRVHRVLDAFGAHVIYTTSTTGSTEMGWRPLEVLLAESDIVSLHVPATPATEKLLDARRLALLRPGAVLINTARGSLIDEAALIDALRRGHVAAAGLDVFATEPAGADNELFDLPNVVVTPHVAWATASTMRRCVEAAAQNWLRFRSGGPLTHQVA